MGYYFIIAARPLLVLTRPTACPSAAIRAVDDMRHTPACRVSVGGGT